MLFCRFYDAFPDNSWLVNATYYGHGDKLDDFFRFYDAFPDNSWLVNATYYGHGDNLDDFYADAVHVSI